MRSTSQYSTGAIAFHWIIAALIVLNFVLAWWADTLPKPEQMKLMGIHMATGLTVLALSVISVLWRLGHPRPPFEPTLQPWEVALARVVHTLFWFLIIAIPFTGWSMVSAYSGEPVNWFGLFSVPALPVPQGEAPGGTFNEVHELLTWAMLGLLFLHVAGALKHQLLDHDATLGRMIPWLRRAGT